MPQIFLEHSKICSVPYHCRQCNNKQYKSVTGFTFHLRKYHKVVTLDEWHQDKRCEGESSKRPFATEYGFQEHDVKRETTPSSIEPKIDQDVPQIVPLVFPTVRNSKRSVDNLNLTTDLGLEALKTCKKTPNTAKI